MKKIYFAVLSFVLLGNVGYTQIIRPTAVYFRDNDAISNYFTQYPDVTYLDYLGIGPLVSSLGALNQLTAIGELEINSAFSLSGLNNVATINGSTYYSYRGNVTILSNFSGLNGLTSMGGELRIQATVSGFTNLNTIGGNSIFFSNEFTPAIDMNSIVTSMPTFSSLLNFTGSIGIGNTSLSSISFSNLCLPSLINIYNNENLNSISGFNNSTALEELIIQGNPNLTSINAFSGLQSTSGRFLISDNPSLQTVNALGSLTNVSLYQFFRNGCQHLPNTPLLTNIGSLSIDNNPSLIDLSGLNGLTTINDTFSLLDNNALATVAHLGNLTTIGNLFYVVNCDSLANFSGSANPQLDGLNNLTTVGGDLIIDNNDALTSLSALGNINTGTINALAIRLNPLLTTCAIQSVCDKIALQSNTVFIGPNGTNCNRTAEIANACNPITTPTFTAIEPICSGTSLSPLPTTSNNGIIGTWSPAFDNSTTTEYTFAPDAGQNASTTTLTITVNLTTINTTLISACDSYTWAHNGETYTTSGVYTGSTTNCVTEKLDLTITPSSTNTTTVSSFQTYTWANNGETYTTSGIKTGTTTNCVTELLDLTISTTLSAPVVQNTTRCKVTVGVAPTATALPDYSLVWYSSATSSTALAATPLITSSTKTYWVAQRLGAGPISPRAQVTTTVNQLPATPVSMTTTDAVLCKHIGTTNEVTYTVPVVAGIEEYSWTLPEGVTAIGATNTNSITVNLEDASTSIAVGGIGTISARAISAAGCLSAPRALVLTSKLPTSPTSLTLTSADTNANFNSGVPSVPTSLSDLSRITKVGSYMGTDIVFTLTALTAPTATSYAWTLPAGVNQLSGGTSNVITVDFAGVTPGIGLLAISVKSVGGCGSASVARTLNLSRALPTAPTALVVTDDAISSTTAITKVSAYTGKTTPLTLTATPARVQGATATSYAWLLPAGVNIVSPAETTDVIVQQSVNTGTFTPEGAPIFEIRDFAAISTGTASTIIIDFADVASGITSFPLTVFAVNGTGNSKARTRTVTAAAPTSPAITAVGGTTFNSCNLKTYSVVQTLGTSYAWTVPAGADYEQTGNVIVVDYSGVEAAVGATVQVTCTASNGTGSSAPKLLNVKRVACPVRLSNSSANAFSIKAYPNPSSSEFTIQTSAKGAMSVKVYDMQGRLVEKADTNRVGARLATGTYNVIVNQGANTKTLRVIKK